MRWRSVSAGLLWAMLSAGAGVCQTVPGTNGSAAAVTAGPELKPWVSRQAAFNIPYSIELQQGTPTEVQLFVSRDGGQTWQFHSRQAPTAKHFTFRAPGDGQFWFASRTIDPQRGVPRVEELRPELHVVVDTTPPQMDFTAVVGTAGEVKTLWKASDPGLDPQSLKIEYQATPSSAWRQVALDPTRVRATPGSIVGELTWWPESAAEAVSVRAEIADAAGNKAVIHRQVVVTQTATKPVGSIPADPYANQPGPAHGVTTWPSDNQLPPASQPASTETASAAGAPSVVNPRDPTESSASSSSPLGDASPTFPVSTSSEPPRDSASQSVSAPPATAGLPPGEKPSMTNSRQFQLEYQLDAVVPGGVEEVQLWGTTDYGKTWNQWLLDQDRQSPAEVQVEREGIYGFRVVIVGRNGLATPAPQPGDLADVWVGVDVTHPSVRITSASYGEGLHAGELDIRWQTIDEALGDRPVSILYSERPDGPWTSIAAGLPDTGQYFWKIDPHTPAHIYLRIEVRDGAGNLGSHQLVDPLSTRGLVPQAFIRSVRPLNTSPPTSPPGS